MFASARTFARAVHVASPRPRSSSTTTTTTRAAAGDVWMPGSARPKYLDGTAPGCVRAIQRSTISRCLVCVCVFFLNRDSSVSTREEGVDTFGRRSIGIGDRVVGWMSRSSRMFDRAGSDRVKNRRRRVDEHSTSRRRGRRWTTTGVRVRRSSRPVTRTNERTDGWMDARSKIRVDSVFEVCLWVNSVRSRWAQRRDRPRLIDVMTD